MRKKIKIVKKYSNVITENKIGLAENFALVYLTYNLDLVTLDIHQIIFRAFILEVIF